MIAALLMFFLLGDSLDFADVTQRSGIHAASQVTASAWADFDRDGLPDLALIGSAQITLYNSLGDGAFRESPRSQRLRMPDANASGAVWADYDNDGFPDLYVFGMGANRLFRNLAGEGFADVTLPAGVGDIGNSSAAAWGDFDADGWLDLYVANAPCPDCAPNERSRSRDALYRNKGNGAFTDVSGLLGFDALLGAGMAARWLDYDNDRDLDLLAVNDSDMDAAGNRLWRNDGAGGAAWRFHNAASQTDTAQLARRLGMASGDVDNDGDPDILAAGETPHNAQFSSADFDNDGRIDFALTTPDTGLRLYRNVSVAGMANNWLALDMQGGSGIDRDAIGTRVTVETDTGLRQTRAVHASSGAEKTLRFGLGDGQIRRVVVSWLDGTYHEYTRVPVNRRCAITRTTMQCH